MGKIILKNAVKRESGFLYYVDGQGNICQAKMARKSITKSQHGGKK